MTRTEAVVSALLCDPPATITGPIAQSLVRSLDLDPNYQATVAAGYVESLDEYTIRISRTPQKPGRTR